MAQRPTREQLEADIKKQLRSYGYVDDMTLGAIRVLNSLQPADLATIDPQDRLCIICRGTFGEDDEADRTHHKLLRLPCGHVLGKSCLHIFLSPIHDSRNIYTTFQERKGSTYLKVGSNTCPYCSRELFPAISDGTDIHVMRLRLRLWDTVYSTFRIPLTEADKEVRAQLVVYSHTQLELAEHMEGYKAWDPRKVHPYLFDSVCQYMVKYAIVLITLPDGCDEQNWGLAQKFLERYRQLKTGHYYPQFWFSQNPEIDRYYLDKLQSSDWDSEASERLLSSLLATKPNETDDNVWITHETRKIAKQVVLEIQTRETPYAWQLCTRRSQNLKNNR